MMNYTAPASPPKVTQTTSIASMSPGQGESTIASVVISLGKAQAVFIHFWVLWSVGAPGITRVMLKVLDGSIVLNQNAQVADVEFGDAANNYVLQSFSQWVNLAAGSHTIKVNSQVLGSTSNLLADTGALTVTQFQ